MPAGNSSKTNSPTKNLFSSTAKSPPCSPNRQVCKESMALNGAAAEEEETILNAAVVSSRGASYLSMDARTASGRLKMTAAVGYGLMSIAIMMISKAILTEFNFRCFIFVGFLQYFSTSLILMMQAHYYGKRFPMRGIIRILFVELFPLPMVFMFNTLSGLGATQALNMPLFVLLRRLSIVMTLFGEAAFLRYKHDWEAHGSVALMILGALVATSFDREIPVAGVVLVFINDICTAMNGVLTRWKLDVSKVSSEGIMFYSNVFAAFFSGVMLLCNVRGEVGMLLEFDGWTLPFIFLLCANAVSGFCVNYLAYLCMKLNSPLTVSMIGAGKNVVTSYIGMMFSDYEYSRSSFVGVNLSVVGCVLYSHREMVRILGRRSGEEKQQAMTKKENPETEAENTRGPPKQ